MAEQNVRIHRAQQRPCALEVMSCDDLSSSSNSSDSSNEDQPARYICAEGSQFQPSSPTVPVNGSFLNDNSDDSNSKPFEVSNLDEGVAESERLQPTDHPPTSAPRKSCFYGLCDSCVDQSPGQMDSNHIQSLGAVHHLKETYRNVIEVIHSHLDTVCDGFQPWYLFFIAGFVLAFAIFSMPVAMLVCLFAAMIISAFVAQHLILVSLSHYAPPHNTAFSNPAFQRFMGKYTPIRARLHHVIPCANCREQFARHGIFDFHNRVASRLTKPHICTPPYSGYDYLVAYLVWGMDKAMVETLGHGFLLDNNAEETTDVMHDPARVYVERAFCHGLPSTRLNSNNSNASLREMNNNNSNSSLNFQPESSDVPSDEYETVSENGESNDSMDYLTISQESTDSEGYHTAQNHPGSPTTSMNVHFVHNDDETTEDYTTFSVYTAHSVTTTDSFDDEGEEEEEEVEEERGDDNGVESPDTFTTASHYSSEYATPSCTGSEATQHGSENDTTEGQCGSDATKQESVGDKYLRVLTGLRDKMNSLKARRGKSCSSVNVGDSAMVNQLITESVREHMAISPGTMHTQHSSEPCGDISTNDTEESSNKSVSSCMLRAGSSPPFIPRKYDTMNKNNNGNTLNKGSKSSESNYNKLDEEANIEGCRMLDGPPDNKDGDTISITYDDPMPVECVFDEDDEGFPGQYCDGSSDSNDSNDGSLPNYIPSSPRNVSHLHSCGDNNLRKSNVKSSSSMLACHVASSTSVLSCPIISSSSEPSFFDRGDAQRPSIPPIPPPPGRLHNAAFKLIPPVVDVSSNPQNVTKASYKPAEKQIPKMILPPLPVANFLLPNIGNPQNIRGEDYKENMQ